MHKSPILLLILCALISASATLSAEPTGESVVFIHPDGAGLASWNIYRIAEYGPDGYSQWDLLPGVSVYRSHMRDHLNPTSHAGATVHAYGVKVLRESFGKDGKEAINGASGFSGSLMDEAKAAGLNVGIINSGQLAEPGTAVMLASVDSRNDRHEIAAQLIDSGADLIFGGGEVLFLPEGVVGKHGDQGSRKDGRNLVEEAKEKGYTVIYTLEELQTLSADTEKVLGLFAVWDTFYSQPEEEIAAEGKTPYIQEAPTVGQMTEAALKWFASKPTPFFLMVEEEGSDNLPNNMNANGMIEAVRRADAAIGAARKYVAAMPEISLIVAADSEAGGPDIIDYGLYTEDNPKATQPVPAATSKGVPLDGAGGTETPPFISAPDRFGNRHLFAVAWVSTSDHFGAVLVRGEGPIAKRMPANMDNTSIYKLIHQTLFGQ